MTNAQKYRKKQNLRKVSKLRNNNKNSEPFFSGIHQVTNLQDPKKSHGPVKIV